MAIVYQHRRKDNNQLFYVGVGKNEKRAYVKYPGSRGPNWRKYVAEHEYIVEITHRDICWEEACSIEKYLIEFYGRVDLGTGCLMNMTAGGESIKNISNETKLNISISKKGKQISESHKINIGLASKKRWEDPISREKLINSMKGRVLSEETKRKLSNSKKGKPTWSKGKKHTDEHKKNNSLSKIGKVFKKEQCIHCGKLVAISKIKQWHNNNCKLKNKL